MRITARGAGAVLLGPQAWLLLVSGYLGLLTGAAWAARRRGGEATELPAQAGHRFVVLIPAHDEERGLGTTLDSVAQLDYPPDLFSVHVVADNCTDATAAVARRHGVHVHERVDALAPGKGPALSWLLRRLDATGVAYDAVAVIDADSSVSAGFLRVMDARLARGDRVVQGYYGVRDVEGSWVVALRGAALAARHYLRPLGRTSLGGSAGLHGNGMVFSAEVMHDRSWSGHLTEDIELEAELLLDGERVAFAPDAQVAAEMPVGLAGARSQNERWERGRVEVAKRYVPRLLQGPRDAPMPHRLRCVDAAVDHLVPPLSMVAAATVATGLLSGLLWVTRRTALSRFNLVVSLAVGGTQAAYVASGLHMTGAPRSVWISLLRAPLFVLWKLPLWLQALVAGPTSWIRTARNA